MGVLVLIKAYHNFDLKFDYPRILPGDFVTRWVHVTLTSVHVIPFPVIKTLELAVNSETHFHSSSKYPR
jgi:hypothetical protein